MRCADSAARRWPFVGWRLESLDLERWSRWLGWIVLPLLLLDLAAIFLYAPTDALQGNVQRVFYIHVPLALDAFGAFFVTFVGSAIYLWKRDRQWDLLAASSAEVGVVMTTLVLVTGSLWAKPIWGTWWTWDARLTTTLILWLIYLAYMLVRASVYDAERAARYAAVIGLIGFLDVPIIRQSVVWWRTLHPGPTIIQAGGSTGVPPEMMLTLAVSVVAFGVLYAYLLARRVAVSVAREAREAAVAKAREAEEARGPSVASEDAEEARL